MTNFIIHSIPGSPYGRAALMILEEKGLPYQLRPVAPGTFRLPEHLARHPFGRVPVLEHGEFSLYETQAILRYIDRIAPTPSFTPWDAKEAARMDQLMNINDWYLFQGVSSVICFQRVVGPRLMGKVPDEELISAAMPKAHAVFGELSRLLGDQRFFANDELSLVDILMAPQLDFFFETPEWETLTSRHPNLRSWLERMRARPSMVATTWDRVAAMAKAA
jgi:glutathione S-transferase